MWTCENLNLDWGEGHGGGLKNFHEGGGERVMSAKKEGYIPLPPEIYSVFCSEYNKMH